MGQNAGQQCVATSLCSLIYSDTQGISSANDLIQIMNIGNQLYSSLSQLARRAHLMQSELPTALNVFDTDYQLEYCPSRFLYIYSFIYFFVLLCELTGRLVAMGHVLMCEIKNKLS